MSRFFDRLKSAFSPKATPKHLLLPRLATAIRADNPEQVEKIVATLSDSFSLKEPSIREHDLAYAPFEYALSYRSFGAACVLLHKNADCLDAYNDDLRTPLTTFAQSAVTVDFLLLSGADPTKADKHGNTPLHKAAMAAATDSIQLICDKVPHLRSTLLQQRNKEGHTPLMCLAIGDPLTDNKPSRSIAAKKTGLLLPGETRATNDIITKLQEDTLALVTTAAHTLITCGAKTEERDHDGKTAVEIALSQNNCLGAAALIQAGAAIGQVTPDTLTTAEAVAQDPGATAIISAALAAQAHKTKSLDDAPKSFARGLAKDIKPLPKRSFKPQMR